MSSDSKTEKLLNAFKTNCGKWVCSTHNSESGQPAAIFREIKKQGYVFEEVASNRWGKKVYCPICGRETTHYKLLEIEPKLETHQRNKISSRVRKKILSVYKNKDAFTNATITSTPEIDHKTPWTRLDSDIDTSNILNHNTLVIHLQVGDYDDVVALEDILYWVQISAENTNSYTKNQINTKVVTQAMMNSIDGMDIKLDCTCKDWQYRFAYQATILGYKYGEKEGRPNEDIRANPENRGGVCKHLYSVLSNKRWLQQVTSTLMDWLEQNIEQVNKFLNVKPGMELTLPNELARQNAKDSWKNRGRNNAEPESENGDGNNDTDKNVNNNINNNDTSNVDTETTNDAPSIQNNNQDNSIDNDNTDNDAVK